MADSAPNSHSSGQPTELDRATLIVAGVVLLGAVMSILDTTVVNVAIDRLAVDFHSSLTTIQWVVTGYTLSLATVIPLSGWASDRFGTKRLYLGFAGAVHARARCCPGWRGAPSSLIAFRVLQGIGGGMIMPAVMTIMTQKAGPQRMGRVMGHARRADADRADRRPDPRRLAGRLRVLALDLLHQRADRHRRLHARRSSCSTPTSRRRRTKLDWLGMLLLSPGLALLIYGLAESSPYGFGDARAWVPIVAGAALIAGFFAHSWRAQGAADRHPYVHRRHAPGASAVVFLLFAIAFFGALLLIPLYYQSVRGASALQAGLLLVPQGVGAMITMPIAGRLTDRYGPALSAGGRHPVAGDRARAVRVRDGDHAHTCCCAASASSSASGWGCR